MKHLTFVRTADVLFADVGDDVVALHVAKGACYGMEKVAAEVWHFLEKPNQIEAICRALVAQYDVDPVTCENEVGRFLSELVGEELVAVQP